MLRTNRTVLADGVEYPPGTSLAVLPESNQESVRLNGWAQDDDAEPSDSDSAQQSDQTEQIDPTDTAVQAEQPEQPGNQAEQTDQLNAPQDPVAVTPLEEIAALTEEHRDLLAAGGIHTLEQAKDYLATNKTFRPLKGIGKAGDEQIRDALGL
jgi:hypothetical protein